MRELRIFEFADVVTGGTPTTSVKEYWENGDIPWLNSGELNKGYIYNAENFITEVGLKNSSTKMMPPDTVLIALTGATCGLSALSKIKVCANQSVTGILPSKSHIPEYLFHFLRTQRQRILDKAWGNAQPHISQAFVKDFVVPLPSISDQLHIAKLLNKAENLISQRKESIRLLDEFLKSTFLEMFGDIEKMKNMKFNILSDYIEFLTSGSRGWAKYYSKSGAKFLRIQNVWKGTLRKDELQFVDAPKTQEAIRTRVQEGDLLITITADLGRTAVVPKNFGEAYINQHIALVRLKKMINPTYAAYYFFMPFGFSAIQKKNKSAVKSGLTFNDIKTLPIIVPPIELQTQFAQIVEKTEALKTQYQQSLQELENLYGSLSQKAFRGEFSIKDESLLMAAEPKTSYFAQSNIPDNKRGFAKQVLGGKIVSLFKNDKNFTHIKFQKLQYLAEHIAEENLLWNYYRQAAGPHDNRFKYSVIEKLNENKWFEERNYMFYPLQKANDVDRYYKNYFGQKCDRLNELFMLLKNASEKFCEAIATIYAVWNNQIILQLPYNTLEIKKAFFEWSNRKEIIFTEDEFEKALEWMKKHNIEPTGFGQLIKEKNGKK